MDDEDERAVTAGRRITVEAASVEGILAALDLELVDEPADEDAFEHPDELVGVLDTVADIYRGVHVATEKDSRGRSRKMVRQYAGREDLGSDDVGHVLRVLESHGLVAQDGNRWRIPGDGVDR